ncbi:hypothetical protein [Streptomyces sp. NPDC127108]|uniref:hypothetical protein n=1 Tax=Streptomyces sp. NPDC127108 TaxID=3345361 RepID=UPI003645D1FD
MMRSTASSRRRMAGVAAAALLSLGLLTACGSDSSDSDASRSSSSQKAEPRADSSGKDAKGAKGTKGNSNLTSLAEGLQPGDSLATHTIQLSVDGGTEGLAGVDELALDQPTEQTPSNRLMPGQRNPGTVTVVRGATRSQQFTDLIDGKTQPGTAALSMLDYAGNQTKQYTLEEPRVIKVDNAQTGDAQSVTIQFTNLTIG